MSKAIILGMVSIGALLASCGPNDGKAPTAAGATPKSLEAAEAAVPENPLKEAYFGEQHVHTSYSLDAYIGGARLTPSDAYRFAKGEHIGHPGGYDIRLTGGPLDFVAVTDHAEYIGSMEEANRPNSVLSKLPITQGLFSTDPKQIGAAFTRIVTAFATGGLPPEFQDKSIQSRAWKEIQDAAAKHNDPGRFTTLVGYEFTSAPDGRNMHRNVIFRSSKVSELPYSAVQSANPEDLWRTMDVWRKGGVESLAIPHNMNGSDGMMFQTTKFDGTPMDKAYADMRRRNEPIAEMTQIKGTSDTHPSLSPNDEWANFEIMETYIGSTKAVTKFAGGYVRQALKDGLVMQDTKGFNPFKFGFIGSSDTHLAAPGLVDDRDYHGKVGRADSAPALRGSVPNNGAKSWDEPNAAPNANNARFQSWGASGLAGVWAEENTREALYSALRRRETFATSGPRMRVRFFASYDYPSDILSNRNLVTQAYAKGVPMGSDLLSVKGKTPKFIVWGVRDPNSGYLQRAQVVKGWVENGKAMEKVFDVACSDGLPLDKATSRCPDNGATVNTATCETSRFKGDAELRTLWTDPEFNPRQRAFYYVRILENPSCRWSTWDAIRNGTPPAPNLPKTIVERAWSSPIWYEPKA